MKLNWRIALCALATVVMVACKDKKEVTDPGTDPGTQTEDTTKQQPTDYTSPIKINDKSIADWDKLDQSKVAVAKLPNDPLYTALKEIRVYADQVYINYIVIFDPEEMISHTPLDVMHIYMNADNSDETGGYWDQFDAPDQGNTDLMFEGPIWGDNSEQISYNPAVSVWAGALNGEGWLWEEVDAAGSLGASQFVEDGIIEGRLIRQYIPWNKWTDAFEIGFDIQQNYESVGLLPQGNTPNGELIGRARKLYVTFDK